MMHHRNNSYFNIDTYEGQSLATMQYTSQQIQMIPGNTPELSASQRDEFPKSQEII